MVVQMMSRQPHGGFTPHNPPPREKTVAVYGGARIPQDSPLYKYCQDVGRELAKEGFAVLTGGGPGAMRAAAEGAKQKGGYAIGAAMDFIGEEPFPGNDERYVYKDFSARIDQGYEPRAALTASVPGGMGTLQELTKKATELDLDKSLYPSQKQIVLFDYNDFWKKWIKYLKEGPIADGLMSDRCLKIFKVVDSIPEGIQLLKKSERQVPWTPGLDHAPPLPEKYTEAGQRLKLVA